MNEIHEGFLESLNPNGKSKPIGRVFRKPLHLLASSSLEIFVEFSSKYIGIFTKGFSTSLIKFSTKESQIYLDDTSAVSPMEIIY